MDKEQALGQIDLIRSVMAENRKMVSNSAPFLILWGLISIAGFGSTPILKQWGGLYWTIAAVVGGSLSAYIGRRQDMKLGRYAARVGKQIGLVFTGMFFSGWAVTLVLLANGDQMSGPVLGVLIGVAWCALISMAWLAAGILTDSLTYMLPTAVLLLASGAVSALTAPDLFYPTIAVFGGGGGMVIVGLIAAANGRRSS